MLLTITATKSPALPDARDLGYLLHKNPASVLEKSLGFGTARVFWPEASEARATCALAVEVDPVGLVRGRADSLFAYVSDRPYAASSFLSVALSQCFASALGGRAKEKAELVGTPLSLSARPRVRLRHPRAGVRAYRPTAIATEGLKSLASRRLRRVLTDKVCGP